MKCDRKNCENEATVAIKVVIPAKGYDLKDHTPLAAFMGLKVCKPCLDQLALGDVLTDEAQQNFTELLGTQGLAPPDYERAKLEGVPLDSPEFEQFQQVLSEAPQ